MDTGGLATDRSIEIIVYFVKFQCGNSSSRGEDSTAGEPTDEWPR